MFCTCTCTCCNDLTIEDGQVCRQCVLGSHDPRADRAREAACLTIREGGATLLRETLLPVKPATGYAVGLARNTAAMVTVAEGPEAIAAAILRVWRKYPDAGYIGTWVTDAMLVCVDPVVIEDHVEKALELARRHAQVAIYDFAKGKDVLVQPELSETEKRLMDGDR